MTPAIGSCRCGQEVRIVRLNAKLLGLGHVSNPRDGHHVVRLTRSAAASLGQGDGPLSGVPEVPVGASPAGRSPRASRVVPDVSMSGASSSPARSRSRRGPLAHASGSAERLTRP